MKKTTAPKKAAAPKKTAAPKKAAAPKKPAARAKGKAAMSMQKVEEVRMMQRNEGNFDCFGRAEAGYCDQDGCMHYADCMTASQMMFS